jgi:1-acyl-sn-glycerol-3-phosphate acyltransferase
MIAWFSRTCIGIIPLDRSGNSDKDELFSGCLQALDQGNILIIFPEGSRGNPEKISKLRKGIFYLLKDRPGIPIIPVVMHGLGRALPKGEALLVPFNCDVSIGEPLQQWDAAAQGIKSLSEAFGTLLASCPTYREAE